MLQKIRYLLIIIASIGFSVVFFKSTRELGYYFAIIVIIFVAVGVSLWWFIAHTLSQISDQPSEETFKIRAEESKDKVGTSRPDGGLGQVDSGNIYSHLMTYYLHQDKLSWSRIQTLIAVEAGILAVGVSVPSPFALLALIFGTFVVWSIWILVIRDWEIRDQNLKLIDTVHAPKGIWMTRKPSRDWFRGSHFLPVIVWAVIMINLMLLAIHITHPEAFNWGSS